MADAPILVCTGGTLAGASFPITAAGLSFGRADDNDLVLHDDGVSRYHAHLQYDDGTLWLRDTGSRNGVFVNDKRLADHKDLRVGDVIRIGEATFEVRWEAPRPKEDDRPEGSRRSWLRQFDR